MTEFFTAVGQITLFGGFIWFAILSLVLFVLLITTEVKKDGFYASGFVIAFLAIFYFWGNVPLYNFFSWSGLGIYLGCGLVYAMIRTFFFGRTQKQDYLKEIKRYPKTKYEDFIENDDLKDNVFRWWFMWPISLLTWMFTDLISKLYDLVYQLTEKFFNHIKYLGGKTVASPSVTTTEIVIRNENELGDR